MSIEDKSGKVHSLAAYCTKIDNGNVDVVIVRGLVRSFSFSRNKIAEKKNEIVSILNDMPPEFHDENGGGWTFLNLCTDKDGVQWTGYHMIMEELVCLGIAAGVAQWQLKEFAESLPGGVPYVVFDTTK